MVIVIFLFCLSKVQLHGFDARVSLVDSHLYVIYQIGLVNVHPAGIEVGTIYDRQIVFRQKPIRVETCNGPFCAGKQASEYSIS